MSIRDFERHNLDAVNSLNQRGERMLSLVDLLDAGTLNLDMAAEMAAAAAHGASFLTAAGPGGAGKTTLMAAALAFLPPGTEIVTVEGPDTLDRVDEARPDRPQCLVVHEIGSGAYYGYLWGPDVARYFRLAMQPGRSLASNLHAETYEEAVRQLAGRPLGVPPEAVGRVGLLAFMAAARGKRRVTALWKSDGRSAGHRQAWRWRREEDAFEAIDSAAAEADVQRFRDFLARAQAAGVRLLEDLRRAALAEVFQVEE